MRGRETARKGAPSPGCPLRSDHGQASVEFALVLPLVFLMALFLVQCGVVVRDVLMVQYGARVGLRTAITDPQTSRVVITVTERTVLSPERLRVGMTSKGKPGDVVRVSVRYDIPTEVPLVGWLLPDVHTSATLSGLVESGATSGQ